MLPVRKYGDLRDERYYHKLDSREYNFLVEFERTRTPKAIFDEKIRLNEKVNDFRKYVLSKRAKFLYVFMTENFYVTTRPVKYPAYRPMIQSVEKQFEQLRWLDRKLSYHRYKFAFLLQFREFEKVVWVMPSGRRVKIT